MSKLRPARNGLTYLDAQRGKLVEISGEALEVERRLRERWPHLSIYFDKDDLVWVFTEVIREGPRTGDEVLVMKSRRIDEDYLMDRLTQADPTSDRYVDPLKVMDDAEAAEEKKQGDRIEEITGEAGERLIHAFKKDGLYDHLNIYGTRADKKTDTIRAHNVRRRVVGEPG